MVNLHVQQRAFFRVGPGERVLQFASLSFDASVLELILALTNGGALCLSPPGLVPGPELARFIEQLDVTAAFFTPSSLSVMSPEMMPGLRQLLVGGEEVTAEVVDRWSPNRKVFNIYGPTEATVWATTTRLESPSDPPPLLAVHCQTRESIFWTTRCVSFRRAKPERFTSVRLVSPAAT